MGIRTITGQIELVRYGERAPAGVITRVMHRLLSLASEIWHNENTCAATRRSMVAYDH